MPSFDIVSKVDPQLMDNAVNVTRKEITNRFDFKDSHVVIEMNKKDLKIAVEADDDMKMRQLTDVLLNRSIKQGIDPCTGPLQGSSSIRQVCKKRNSGQERP